MGQTSPLSPFFQFPHRNLRSPNPRLFPDFPQGGWSNSRWVSRENHPEHGEESMKKTRDARRYGRSSAFVVSGSPAKSSFSPERLPVLGASSN